MMEHILKNAQIVYSKDNFNKFDEVSKFSNGCAITVLGKLVLTSTGKQPFEI